MNLNSLNEGLSKDFKQKAMSHLNVSIIILIYSNKILSRFLLYTYHIL